MGIRAAQNLLTGADERSKLARAYSMSAQDPVRLVIARDSSSWRIGTDADVGWIVADTSASRTITAAIPPVFEAYATIVLPHRDEGQDKHDRAVLALLSEQSAGQPWWLGYLDTGADDVVFPDAPMVSLYAGWQYVLVEAGPEQAATWRRKSLGSSWTSVLPNVIFPVDRSWLFSTLWDDDWSCLGGPAGLVNRFLQHPDLRTRPVVLGQDATPPGHRAL